MPTPNDLKPIFTLHRKADSRNREFPEFDALPDYWKRHITKLRKENAKGRIDLRDTRAELAEAHKRIAEQIADIADLKDELKTAVAK